MAQNQVTLKGIVDPQAVCNRIIKKTKRRATVLSPLPPADGKAVPQVVPPQVCKRISSNFPQRLVSYREEIKK